MDADKFLSWLSEVEGEIRKEKMCKIDAHTMHENIRNGARN